MLDNILLSSTTYDNIVVLVIRALPVLLLKYVCVLRQMSIIKHIIMLIPKFFGHWTIICTWMKKVSDVGAKLRPFS